LYLCAMVTKWMIWLLPVIASVIGWFTNYIAVKMLFHPQNPVKIFGFTIQGVLPKRQKQMAVKIGKLVSDELFSSADLHENINNPENVVRIIQQIDMKIDNYFNDIFPEKHPYVAQLIPKKVTERIKNEMLLEVQQLAPSIINKQVDYLEENIDIEEIIKNRVEKLKPADLERILWSILSTEFRFIEAIGAVIGFFIGLVQVLITFLA
jgi:uncharacterized membrane protein YheB (UPF0754 family)